MKKLLKIIFWTVLLLIIFIMVAGFIFIKTFDLNKYKTMITDLASKELGRTLSIKGDAELGLSLVPTIILNDIELANASWASHEFMVKVKKIEVSFAIMPLLQKQIVINNVELVEPQIYLEKSEKGKENWVFEKAETSESAAVQAQPVAAIETPVVSTTKASAEAEGIDSSMALLGGLAAKSVSITNGILNFDDRLAGSIMNLEIKDVNLSIPSPDDKIKAHVNVIFDGNSIVADATTGSINTFLENKEPFPVTLNAKAYGASAKISGTLENILNALKFDLAVEASNPSGNFGAPQVDLNTKVTGDLSKVTLDISSLEVAKNKITGVVSAIISTQVPYVEASLQSDSIDLTKFAADTKTVYIAPSLVKEANASELVPDTKIPYEFLNMANANIDLNIKRLIVEQGLQATNVLLKTTLQNGVLKVAPLSLNFGSGDITVNATVNAKSKSLYLTALSKNMLLQDLHKEFIVEGSGDFGVKEGGNFDVDIDISATGDTARQLVNALNGKAIIIVDETKFSTGTASFMQGTLLSKIVKTIKLDKVISGDVDVKCAVVRADLEKGKAVFPNGIALDATQVNISSNGNVNLVSDTLDFTLQPSITNLNVTNVAQMLTSLVKIGGTITNPTIGVDEKQALKTVVGTALNASAYAGTVVAGGTHVAPCYTALVGTKYEARFPQAEGTVATGQQTYKDAEQAVKEKAAEVKTTVKETVKELSETTKNDLNTLKESSKQLLNSFKSIGKTE
ncbi:MAG: AsmA family protein [Lactobacillus sp.]|jgi:uncharacterized protein involved in outer membrane biogenesis|nr:AsmA family protein [Lactobacillus sp.]